MGEQYGMGLHAHIISRDKAKELGIKNYFTGIECGKSGIAWYRYTSNKGCTCEACRKSGLDRQNRYYKENRDSRIEYQRRYMQENHEEILERKRRYREENQEYLLEKSRQYHQENRESIAEKGRKYYQENREALAEYQRRYYKENREAFAERKRKYLQENPHIPLAQWARRRAAKRRRTLIYGCELTNLVEREAYDLARERKEQTGVEWHVDHMLPMQGDDVSGFHHWSNLQVIPATLNLEKNNRMIYTEPFEWLSNI